MCLTVSSEDDAVGYLLLPEHPGLGTPGAVKATIRLRDLLDYIGPEVHLDLDSEGTLIGLEIID